MVANMAANIRVDASHREVYGSVDPAALTAGQHVNIHINHPDKGRRHVEMVAVGARIFYLLKSDISGLELGMGLFAIDKVWNNAFDLDFWVSSDGKRFPDKRTMLRIGKLERVDLYAPSTVHEILDADSDFGFDSEDSGQQAADSGQQAASSRQRPEKLLLLIAKVKQQVERGTVGEAYEQLRKEFIAEGVSSYTLGLLIGRMQAQRGEAAPLVPDGTFFVRDEHADIEENSDDQTDRRSDDPPDGHQEHQEHPKFRKLMVAALITLAVVAAGVILLVNVDRQRTVTIQTQFGYWTGHVRDNKPDGDGFLRYYTGDHQNRAYYRGAMKGWVREGFGCLHYNDSSYFEGTFSNDRLQEGVFYNAGERRYFEGTWVDDMLYDGKLYELHGDDTTVLYVYQGGTATRSNS